MIRATSPCCVSLINMRREPLQYRSKFPFLGSNQATDLLCMLLMYLHVVGSGKGMVSEMGMKPTIS